VVGKPEEIKTHPKYVLPSSHSLSCTLCDLDSKTDFHGHHRPRGAASQSKDKNRKPRCIYSTPSGYYMVNAWDTALHQNPFLLLSEEVRQMCSSGLCAQIFADIVSIFCFIFGMMVNPCITCVVCAWSCCHTEHDTPSGRLTCQMPRITNEMGCRSETNTTCIV
jgi:hypothetical protein